MNKAYQGKSVRIKRKTNRIIICYRKNNNSFMKILRSK